MRVDIWSDVVCPFCYIGKKRLEHVAAEAGIELEIFWHSFQLDPDAPEKQDISNSERLAQKYGRSIEDMQQMEQNVAEMAASEGIDFQWQQAKAGNTFNAHRIIHLAQREGLGTEAEEAFFYSYITQGLPIGERETLEDVAARIGLNPVEVDDVLDSNAFAEFVEHDEKIAREQLKVTGVPFFVFDQRVALAGAQPREVFLQVLQQAQANVEQAPEVQDDNDNSCTADGCEVPKA
ncbi:MAG: DsbA family oxidoreductase [Acinetobacter sp.]